MQINSAVAQTIRELRNKNKVSQEKLAEAIDSHQVYISEIENGKKIPSLPVLYKIAQFFELSLSEISVYIDEKIKESS